jgi:hypothetical protein
VKPGAAIVVAGGGVASVSNRSMVVELSGIFASNQTAPLHKMDLCHPIRQLYSLKMNQSSNQIAPFLKKIP